MAKQLAQANQTNRNLAVSNRDNDVVPINWSRSPLTEQDEKATLEKEIEKTRNQMVGGRMFRVVGVVMIVSSAHTVHSHSYKKKITEWGGKKHTFFEYVFVAVYVQAERVAEKLQIEVKYSV